MSSVSMGCGRRYGWLASLPSLVDVSTYLKRLTIVDNSRHCDFSKLRYMLLGSHLEDLKEITHDVLYEQYRTEKLSREGGVADED